MSKSGTRLGFLVVTLTWCGWMLFTSPSSATLDMQKQAKAAGVDAKNCQTCHVAALPKKESHDLNDAGQWLVAEKDKRGAKAVDGAWLKDYPGKK
jgi:hypothetical protein